MGSIHTFKMSLTKEFGRPVRRVALRGGFGCPHGRCLFCSGAELLPHWAEGGPLAQLRLARRTMGAGTGLIPYLQDGTATSEKPNRLEALVSSLAGEEGVVALAISARPDCCGPEVLGAIVRGAKGLPVWLDMGLQSSHPATLAYLNRGHGVGEFVEAAQRAHGLGLRLCAHVILGLPGEGPAEEAQTAGLLGRLAVEGVKVHGLYVARSAPLEGLYSQGKVELLGRGEYVNRAVSFLEHLPWAVVVHRLAPLCRPPHLVAPDWAADPAGVAGEIHRAMKGTRQGALASGLSRQN